MIIDRLMSRFRIQTKVVVLVLPFVASIMAVGLTGLYCVGAAAGPHGNLQQRHADARRLQGCLCLDEPLLLKPDEATYRDVSDRVEAQSAALGATAANLAGEPGVEDLAKALEETRGISANVETLWNLHGQQLDSSPRSMPQRPR